MHRARSADRMSDDGDEGAAEKEAELQRLQRDYRNMQGDRQAFTEQMQVKLNRQRRQIDNLNQEQEELKSLLALAESVSNQVRDNSNCQSLHDLAEKKDDLEARLEAERKKQQELDAKIAEWERNIKKQLKSMGGAFLGVEHTQQTQRKTRVLENRLDIALQRFNTLLTQNSRMRKEIDDLRFERNRFEQVYEKLAKERQRLRQEIGKVIEESTQAYEQREEAQAKMVTLKEKNEKDVAQHNAEMKELIRVIDHERKLREFMNVKGQGRQEDPQLAAWKEKQSAEAEQKRAELADSVQTYEDAFERIKQRTEEQELDRLVDKYIEKEDSNFALFNYVNEQNNRVEQLQEHIQQIREEMEKFEKHTALVEEQRAKRLRELERRQTAVSGEADECETSLVQIGKILDQLKTGIESLFTKLECDRSTLEEMLGPQDVTEDNMLQYLGVIEQKTNDLLTIKAYLAFNIPKDDERYNVKEQKVLAEVQPPPNMPTVIPPALGDEFETEDEERDRDSEDERVRPYSRKALEDRVLRNVRRREKAISRAEELHAQRFGITNAEFAGTPETQAQPQATRRLSGAGIADRPASSTPPAQSTTAAPAPPPAQEEPAPAPAPAPAPEPSGDEDAPPAAEEGEGGN